MFSFYRPHNSFLMSRKIICWIIVSLLLVGCSGGSSSPPPASVAATGTPGAEASVGERLFVETRFAQAFKAYLDSGGNVNDALPAGDPVMDLSETTGPGVGLPGPFAGLTMNCRACHLVDEHVGTPGGGMRTYADFALRSPIPDRGDGKRTAPRNSPPLVNASLDRPGGLYSTLMANFNRWRISSSGPSPVEISAGCPGKRQKPSITLHKSCVRMTAAGSLPNNSTDFPIASCSPEPIQPFQMNFVCLLSFGPLLDPGPIRKFSTRWSRWSPPM